MRSLDLVSGQFRARVCPEWGASISELDWQGKNGWQPVLVPDPDPVGKPPALASALYLMVPFANRARGNQLFANGRKVTLSPNTTDPLALHGTGWERPWDVLAHDNFSCSLRLDVSRATYPFAFAAELHVALRGEEIRIDLALENTDESVIPVGLGLHPYFPKLVDTELRFSAQRFWLEGPGHLPTDPISLPPELDFSRGRALPATWRNNGYGGWNGRAEIVQPSLGYRLTMTASPGLSELMLYVPPGEARFALEPQSHTSGAVDDKLTTGAVGLAVLPPRTRLSAAVSLQLQPS